MMNEIANVRFGERMNGEIICAKIPEAAALEEAVKVLISKGVEVMQEKVSQFMEEAYSVKLIGLGVGVAAACGLLGWTLGAGLGACMVLLGLLT